MTPAPGRGDPPAPGRAGAPQTAEIKRTLGRVLSTMSLASALAAALVGTVATIALGPFLAMGAAVYLGNTEPILPAAPYPWALLAACGAVGAGGLLLGRARPHREALAHAVVHLAAIAAALLPFLHLFRLWQIADAG